MIFSFFLIKNKICVGWLSDFYNKNCSYTDIRFFKCFSGSETRFKGRCCSSRLVLVTFQMFDHSFLSLGKLSFSDPFRLLKILKEPIFNFSSAQQVDEYDFKSTYVRHRCSRIIDNYICLQVSSCNFVRLHLKCCCEFLL